MSVEGWLLCLAMAKISLLPRHAVDLCHSQRLRWPLPHQEEVIGASGGNRNHLGTRLGKDSDGIVLILPIYQYLSFSLVVMVESPTSLLCHQFVAPYQASYTYS